MALCLAAQAAEQDGVPARFPPPQLIDHLASEQIRPHYEGGDNVSESWSYVFAFPQGYVVNLQFMVTNIGPGEATGVLIAYLIAPDGEVAILKNTRRRGQWRDLSDEQHVELEVAYHRLTITGRRHEIAIDHPDRGKLFLSATALTPAFRPGPLDLGSGFYRVIVMAPRLRVQGRIRLPGHEEVTLQEGRGIALHTSATIGDDRLATGWLRVDTFGASLQASLFELMTSERVGQRRIGFLLLFDGDRLVGSTYRYGRRLLGRREDPHKRTYPLYGGIRFGSEVDFDLRAEAKLQLLNRNALLDFLNSKALRFLLRLISDPVLYQYRAEVTLRRGEQDPAPVRGVGLVSLYLLHRPPAVY